MIYARLQQLTAEAWRVFSVIASAGDVRVVQPSIPVMYFGNLDAYLASSLKVVTVGVNPSGMEFPVESPWSRFPGQHLTGSADESSAYLGVLNGYFDGPSPYRKWFDRSYEPVLNGMDAGYYESKSNRALHTDICSPLATNPVWGGLDRHEQAALAADGVPLWHELIRALQPDVILASVSAAHLRRMTLPAEGAGEVIYSVAQKRPYEVRAQHVACGNRTSLLVSAAPATTPFQLINHEHKRLLGGTIAEIIARG